MHKIVDRYLPKQKSCVRKTEIKFLVIVDCVRCLKMTTINFALYFTPKYDRLTLNNVDLSKNLKYLKEEVSRKVNYPEDELGKIIYISHFCEQDIFIVSFVSQILY